MKVRKSIVYSVEGVDEAGLIPEGVHKVHVDYRDGEPSIVYYSRPGGKTLSEISEANARLNDSRHTRAEIDIILGHLQLLSIEPVVEALRESGTSAERLERKLWLL